jgi:uncharacterized protein YeaO (DUF488 family)
MEEVFSTIDRLIFIFRKESAARPGHRRIRRGAACCPQLNGFWKRAREKPHLFEKETAMKIQVKRVYETPEESDGKRILVDRLWPRGLTKEKAKIDLWAKGISPSNELRRWYGHDPQKWGEFKKRYAVELNTNQDAVRKFLDDLGKGTVTFLFSSKELVINNAAALKEYVESLGIKN